MWELEDVVFAENIFGFRSMVLCHVGDWSSGGRNLWIMGALILEYLAINPVFV